MIDPVFHLIGILSVHYKGFLVPKTETEATVRCRKLEGAAEILKLEGPAGNFCSITYSVTLLESGFLSTSPFKLLHYLALK